MSGCVCSPAIDAEMADWIGLGGGNSGCCGDRLHTYGFHLAAADVPTSDYSRRHDPGRPYNMSWACAGDYYHGGDPRLRAMHATLLARLMRGEMPMVVEFIGMPISGAPVLYWSAFEGRANVRRYTGKGHGLWSHVSLLRSRANQRPYLWRPESAPVVPVVYKPGALVVDGELGPKTIRRWQEVMGMQVRDGVISRPRSALVQAVQRRLNSQLGAGLNVDGAGIAQDGRRYRTTAALQRYLHTPDDGRLSMPRSMCVQALQRRLNAGAF